MEILGKDIEVFMMTQSDATARRRREKFLPEEDARLKELVARFGTNSWEAVAKLMPGRNVRQCRERWKHYICSDSAKIPWTQEEDRILYEKMREMGPKWTKLSAFFPGRTDIQIKTRWMQKFAQTSNLHIRNRVKKAPSFVPTMKTACPPTQHVLVPMHVNYHFFNPKAPTSESEREFTWYTSADGSRSFESFLAWGE
jgi:hypothetical protein